MSCSVRNLDPASASEVNLENLFTTVAKGGDSKVDGRTMSQQTVEQWLTRAKVIDNKTLSQADLAAEFKKIGKPGINYSEFLKLLGDLATSKKIDLGSMKEKLLKAPPA